MAYHETTECRGCHRDRTVGTSGLCAMCFERFTNRRPPIRPDRGGDLPRRAAAQRRLAERRARQDP